MATDFKTIPIIDVSPLLANPNKINTKDPNISQVIQQLHEVCRDVGFFYVKGHGIPESLIRGVRDISHKFFSLPMEEKIKTRLSPATGFRGYTKLLENKTQGKRDLHESIDSYREFTPGSYGPLSKHFEGQNLWPENPTELKPLMEEYVNALEDLSRNIMRGIALAVGGSADTFEGDQAGESFWLMRAIGYPGSRSTEDLTAVGCQAHTDYGLLILVNQDDNVTALQVQNRSGKWVSAVPIPGTLVCNIGDMMKIWTNGLYEPTVHRVVNNSSRFRVSVPFFYEPNFDAVVEPLKVYIAKTGGAPKFDKVVYADYLINKVRNNFVL